MPAPRKVDFYRLPRPVQDRFAAATRRSAPPAPLLYAQAPRTVRGRTSGRARLWPSPAPFVLRLGWGNVTSPFALHGVKLLAVDIVLFAGRRTASCTRWACSAPSIRCPGARGAYLFPGCVVDASGPVLDVWSVGDAEAIERMAAPEPGLALRMRDGSRVVVLAASAEQAEKADAALGSMRQELARAIAEDDPHVLAELDPLHDRAMSSPIGPTGSMKRVLVVSKRFDWVIAAVAGVLLGLGLGSTRNADERRRDVPLGRRRRAPPTSTSSTSRRAGATRTTCATCSCRARSYATPKPRERSTPWRPSPTRTRLRRSTATSTGRCAG